MYIYQPMSHLLKETLEGFSPYFKGKVLDVGSGGFDRSSEFFGDVTEHIRMDISEEIKPDFIGSIYEIPFDGDTFDTVLCTQVFEHLAFPHKAAPELFRVLKRGGYTIITAPQWNELHEEPHDYFRYTNYGLASLFTEAGFEIVRVERLGGYYSSLAQMRIRHLIDRYHLHRRPILGKVAGKLLYWYGSYMVAKDRRPGADNAADRKHTIGWSVVLLKP